MSGCREGEEKVREKMNVSVCETLACVLKNLRIPTTNTATETPGDGTAVASDRLYFFPFFYYFTSAFSGSPPRFSPSASHHTAVMSTDMATRGKAGLLSFDISSPGMMRR